jgi:hypothetical protein
MTTNDYVNYAYIRVARKTQNKLKALAVGKNKTYDELVTKCVDLAAPLILKEIRQDAEMALEDQKAFLKIIEDGKINLPYTKLLGGNIKEQGEEL